MRANTDRIRVTHAGNLPRPKDVDVLIASRDTAAFHRRLPSAVREIVDRQIALGIDTVNDGEYVKAGAYANYLWPRLSGFEMRPFDPQAKPKRGPVGGRDLASFPGTHASGLWLAGSGGPVRPGFANAGAIPLPTEVRVCTGPVKYVAQEQIKEDVANLKAALDGKPVEGYIASLGPISAGAQYPQEHYRDEESYLMACAEAVREEYKAVTDAGLVLQVDEPEFLTTWQFHPDWTVADLRRYLSMCVEVINHALEGIPEESVRFHSCWGSGHRPHTQDIELRHVADLIVKIKARAYSIEAGNVRHQHEWRVWKDVKLGEGKILSPGVISHATDLVEHPELVAERIAAFASIVGREHVVPSTDCGMGSRVGHEEIAWAKLASLAEGAGLATRRLWRGR